MVFPLFDDNTDRQRQPFVNYALIGINILVFVLFQQLGEDTKFTYAFSTVPEEIVTGQDIETEPEPMTDEFGRVYVDEYGEVIERPGLQPTPLTPYLTLLTSMFMHGSIMHILGNMLFLWIFGDNLEDYLGHGRYLVFYLVCGVLASLAHVFSTYAFDMDPTIPSLGASGAISGVLGGYLLLFPQRRVTVILFRFLTEVPAFVAIGLWFVFQVVASLSAFGGEGGGVAFGAHIGGFVAGLILVKLFGIGLQPPRYASRKSYRRY
jgi:membrane associated rhomboid family serine protease